MNEKQIMTIKTISAEKTTVTLTAADQTVMEAEFKGISAQSSADLFAYHYSKEHSLRTPIEIVYDPSKKLSFDEFVATKREMSVVDFANLIGSDEDVFSEAATVLVYEDGYYIEIEKDPSKGKYYLLLCNEDWLSDDLADLEAKLYNYSLNC